MLLSMHAPASASRTSKYAVALILTYAAAFVDIVGFLSVYRLFTAHMTGTTVHFADNLVDYDWPAALAAALVVAAFLAGSIIGRLLLELGARAGVRRIASHAFAIEAVLVACALPAHTTLGPAARTYVPLMLLSAAMGMQTAALTRIGPLTIHTTFVTGMLNRFAQLVPSLLFRRHDLRDTDNLEQRSSLKEKIKAEKHEAHFILGIWFLYVAGAGTGAMLARHWHLKALYLPCALLIAAIAADQVHPLSLEEEKQQLQS